MAGVTVLPVVLYIYMVNGKLENIAFMKPTNATSYPTWPASNAVDGDNDIYGESRTCYHGLNYPSYWTVDLGQEYQLYEVRVYLRRTFEFKTANSIIYLDNNSSRVCYTFPSNTRNIDNPTKVICNHTGRYLTIRNPGTGSGENDLLNICEVEIYGCSRGTYGLDCNSDCNNCLHCNRWSGVCKEDCYPGWTGDYCNTSCSTTTYGPSCKKQCSDRNCMDSTAPCDRFTGSCECGPGWRGVDCRDACDNLHYGVNCSRVCSERKCSGNSSCNHVTGSCDQGCEAGWNAKDCIEGEVSLIICLKLPLHNKSRVFRKCIKVMRCGNQWRFQKDIVIACDNDHYGSGCTGVCSSRHCNGSSVCSSTTGRCEDGCQGGWAGTDCTDCDEFHYGLDCTEKCSDRHCSGNSSCSRSGSCDKGCESGWMGTDCTVTQACDREHYGPDCFGVCASRHCVAVSSCSPTTGQCDGGCQSGWTGLDCTERHPTVMVDTRAVVAGTVTVVLAVLIIVVAVNVFVWRRRKGRSVQQNTSKHTTSITADEVSEMRRKDTGSPEGYDNLHDMSRDQTGTYSEITSLDTVEDDTERAARDVTTGDVYEPVETRTYEKLTTPSRDTDGDYTDLQRKDSYVNVKRTGARST